MMQFFRLFLFFAAAIFLIGCQTALPENISRIEMKLQTGLGGASADIILQRDGTSEFKCNFYNVGKDGLQDDSLQLNSIQQCGKLYKANSSLFKKIEGQSGDIKFEGIFKGKISAEQFEKLSQLIVKNGYFSLNDRYEVPGLMDAPPTITRVSHSGGQKEIINQSNKGGEKLSEIEKAIYNTASEVDWK